MIKGVKRNNGSKINGTTRNRYTKDDVLRLRKDSIKKMPKREGVDPMAYTKLLGDIKAAGHMYVRGKQSLDIQSNEKTGTPFRIKTYNLSFVSHIDTDDNLDESPHFMGYIESASSADNRPYRVKGWLNEDGTIRLEVVSN